MRYARVHFGVLETLSCAACPDPYSPGIIYSIGSVHFLNILTGTWTASYYIHLIFSVDMPIAKRPDTCRVNTAKGICIEVISVPRPTSARGEIVNLRLVKDPRLDQIVNILLRLWHTMGLYHVNTQESPGGGNFQNSGYLHIFLNGFLILKVV